MEISNIKVQWRESLLARRDALNERDRQTYTALAQAHVATLIAEYRPAVLGVYFPIRGEISPLDRLPPHLALAVPFIHEEGMAFARWTDDTPMIQGQFAIPEPTTPQILCPDMIITPLVGVDKGGYRLGYGKGYYDRYFVSDAGKAVRRVGLAFSCQMVDALPHAAHDVRLHDVVTNEGVIRYA